ncbi:hypothetical protein [Streptomyces sp. NBC_00467]|uniref:hypothetical protein n=1 Tax=Streptomyces sp. NBC_00467 TaxID=2975752 RepID=UPI002E194C42
MTAATMVGVAAASPASAAEYPGWEESSGRPHPVQDCAGTGRFSHLVGEDRCWYRVEAKEEVDGAPVPGNHVENCQGQGDLAIQLMNSYQVNQSRAYSEQYQVGFTISAVLEKILTLGVSANYTEGWTTTWGTANTVSEGVTATAKPGEKAWLEFIPKMVRSKGWVEAAYKDPVGPAGDTHREWYYPWRGAQEIVVDTPLKKDGLAVGTWVKKAVPCDAPAGTTPRTEAVAPAA